MAFDLGAMLKDVPKLDTGREQIEYIRLDLIDEDPNNFYLLSGIEALADNIATCGLQQPIRVRRSSENPSRYVIVSGHRRRKAAELLAQEDPDKWQEVACIVERDEISPALQQLRLIYANANTRKMSDAEISEQAAQVEKLLYQLKEEGYEFPGRMRDHVAAAVGASKSKLARLKVIREKLAACWRDPWQGNKIGESVAYSLAQRPVVWQQAIYINWGAHPGLLTAELVSRFCVRFEQIAKIRCSHGQELCSHTVTMMQKNSKESWMAPCSGCCFSCSNLATCKHSCPNAAGKKKELKAIAKQADVDATARQAERDRPGAEFARLVYQRVGLARKASGATVKDLFEAQKKIYSSSIDDPAQLRLESGDGKWTPLTYLPFGYSMQAASAMVICKVADALGCSVDYLLGRTEVMEVAQPTPVALAPVSNWDTWQTGTPPHEGDYILLLQYSKRCPIRVEIWTWSGTTWQDDTSLFDPDVDGEILGWIPMPSEEVPGDG